MFGLQRAQLYQIRSTHEDVTHLRTRGVSIEEQLPHREGPDAKANVQRQESLGLVLAVGALL